MTTEGDAIVIVVDCPVHATAAQAWSVLTDFDHMSSFMSHLETSHAEARGPGRLRVYQKGTATSGLLRFDYQNVSDVELTPPSRIHSRFVAGDLTASEYETDLTEAGGELHIANRGRYISHRFVPPVIGPLIIAAETRKQFAQIRDEILRRAGETAREREAPR